MTPPNARHADDGRQRPLVPRSRCSLRLMLAFGGDLNEASDDRPRRHADACWPRMGALQAMDASPDYKRKGLSRGAVFGKLKVLAGSPQVCELKSRETR